jgi:hypothetical protein
MQGFLLSESTAKSSLMPTYSTGNTYFRSSLTAHNRWTIPLAFVSVFLLLISTNSNSPAGRYLYVFLGTAALFTMCILAFSQEIFELDSHLQKYRMSHTLLGIAHGQWKDLPDIKAIVVRHFSQFKKPGRHRPVSDKATGYYVVLLSVENRATGIVVHKFALHRQGEAKRLAQQLAAYFQVPQLMFDKP